MLNLVRIAAAALVTLGHIRLLFIENYANAQDTGPVTQLAYATTSLGSEAVIVFFVLSGYFVGGGVLARLHQRRFRWFDYGSARLTRLWLVLIPTLLLTLIADRIGGTVFAASSVYATPELYAGIPADPSYGVITLIGNVAFVQDIWVPVYGSNQPLWSLAYEFWYYLLFPAAMVAVWPGQKLWMRVSGAALFVLGCAVSWGDVLLLFPCWVLGALVAGMAPRILTLLHAMPGGLRSGLRLAAFPAVLGTMIVAHEVAVPSRLSAWFVALVTAFAIALFVEDARWRPRVGRLLTPISQTARFSYSLYAIHMPIVVLLAAAIVPTPDSRWPMTSLSYLACCAVVIGISALAWAFALITEEQTDRVRRFITVRTPARQHSSTR